MPSHCHPQSLRRRARARYRVLPLDRKSTRLNSSHRCTSYAVFCLKTKKYGCDYYNKTAWGQIVHHYGRWVSDPQMGRIWTPASNTSPGWLPRRTSTERVGWTQMLPDEDIKTVSASAATNAGDLIFVETQKFAQGCKQVTQAPPSQVPVLLTLTT